MYLMVRHKVSDFNKWKQVFDGDRENFGIAGFKKYGLYKGSVDPGEVIVFLEVVDAEKAKDFFKSEKTIARMKEATVIGTPEILTLDLIDKQVLGGETKAA
jgi:hypothetical protein